jgi:DNA-binding response OmpR family regulator
MVPPTPQRSEGARAARTILVVEDEEPIASAVAARLRSEGFAVEIAADGLAGVEIHERIRPDLVVLDLMLPALDGLEVCRRIRSTAPVPILMLTARDTETDTVVGLEVGADDYMTKPFSPRELVARIHALLRRAERAVAQPAPIHLGDVAIDTVARRVTKDGEIVHLTPTEFELLTHLATRPGVYSRERLLSEVWGYRDGSGTRTVDSHIRGIRRKLGDDVIRTVHGVGYALGDHEDVAS